MSMMPPDGPKRRVRRAALLALLSTAACSDAPPAQIQTPSPPPPAAEAAAQPAATSEAIARADALLEDFRRREAAQAKFDRENPPPKFVPIPRTLIDAARTASSSASPDAPAANEAGAAVTAPAAPAAPATTTPERNENWWRSEMQSLQVKLDAALATLAEAEKANFKYGYNDAQAEYRKRAAAVANARQAIEQLRDEARRAGVPPGWLRP